MIPPRPNPASANPPPDLEILISAEEVAARVNALAGRLAPRLGDDAVAVCLLMGGLWFAADLTRALSGLGRNLTVDALWLASYGDSEASAGRCETRAGLQRPVAGRQVLIMDDVVDTGLSLSHAVTLVRAAGAREVITTVFARKPWPAPRAIEPDDAAWDAPARFLVGYGMDQAGGLRGLPYVAAVR
jgi:hypoxanthine phosphoribosyltransferase